MKNFDHFNEDDFDIIIAKTNAENKQEALALVSKHIANHANLSEATIYTRLMQKEKIQSSGTGRGLAIPHARVINMQKPVCMLMTLKDKINFEASDNAPVDIVCTLLSPRRDNNTHLQSLSKLSRILRNDNLCEKMRTAKDSEALRKIVVSSEDSAQAA